MADLWEFWIDRGGTFTDVVARQPGGAIVARKLLSENPQRYEDAAIQGIRDSMGLGVDEEIPIDRIAAIKMGTTVATNALLERKGDRTLLLITKGFGDALRIGYQHRPKIFDLHIVLPDMLYDRVLEIEERIDARGNILTSLEISAGLMADLRSAYNSGIRACAIVLLHGYRYPQHELALAAVAKQVGFTQVSVSHEVSALMKLVSRGDTTVADAYLSPVLHRYIHRIVGVLGDRSSDRCQLLFMQSHGGLVASSRFQGKDSILSGPAGGIVGAVETSLQAGFDRIIGFDMGGTSTDVSHFNGEYERTLETIVAGVRLRSPMLAIHTVAAGGGSILSFDGSRYRVGPESAGANPGPACYRHGGRLTVTDANVLLGKIQPAFFPAVFGKEGNLPLDREVVAAAFGELTAEINLATGGNKSAAEVAAGFLTIAVDKMAKAIKQISVRRGYDLTEYTLCCFGGAGGQHACAIADVLGMKRIFLHPLAGVLSAYGMGLARLRVFQEAAIELPLSSASLVAIEPILNELASVGSRELEKMFGKGELILSQAGINEDFNHSFDEEVLPESNSTKTRKTINFQTKFNLNIRYAGTDSTIAVSFTDLATIRSSFEELYRQRYGFAMSDREMTIESLSVEIIHLPDLPKEDILTATRTTPLQPIATVDLYTANAWQQVPVYRRETLVWGDRIAGVALIVEATGTIAIEPGWVAEVTEKNCLVLDRVQRSVEEIDGLGLDENLRSNLFNLPESSLQQTANKLASKKEANVPVDPMLLEIFNNLFSTIAEEMGITLQNTSYSVNIKERLDFSCAIFDGEGKLVANAPHIPVHLGSMGESVASLIVDRRGEFQQGDVYITNNPYNGGTHLPDITAITPVFAASSSEPLFYVASRGHHADIGGITPGSMPPHSRHIAEEGILFDNFQLVSAGIFRAKELLAALDRPPYPARNPSQNIADLQAQIAANERGVSELQRAIRQFGLATVKSYMQYIRENAAEAIRQAIVHLEGGSFTLTNDNGSQIQVTITISRDDRRAKIDFTGTSSQQPNNFNAPLAICKAAVSYVFRTLVTDEEIPLNAGCLEPLEIIVPPGSLLDPQYPAAVVAGNVETSQAIVNALYGALGVLSASAGTMNNFTFGNSQCQYYETICGGSGAGKDFPGTDAVQTHMTNSRLSDPEVLEWRFPVLVEEFRIRDRSGGKGKHFGGNGTIRRIQFREPLTAAILSSNRINVPFGLKGGEPGMPGKNYITRFDGTIENLPSCAEVTMYPGDSFTIETPGGGGYGTIDE